MKVKEQATKTVNDIKRVVNNGEQFVQSASLLVVAGFSYWALSQVKLTAPAKSTVLVSLIIIGLRGAVEFIKFLNKGK